MPLTAKQTEYLAIAWSCFESEPKIDYDKFHKLAGLASPASARELLRVTKKKLYAETPALAGAATTTTTTTTMTPSSPATGSVTGNGGGDKVVGGRVSKKGVTPGTPTKGGMKKAKGKAVERLAQQATPLSDDGVDADLTRVKREPTMEQDEDLVFT